MFGRNGKSKAQFKELARAASTLKKIQGQAGKVQAELNKKRARVVRI